jgi:hypothetical protein
LRTAVFGPSLFVPGRCKVNVQVSNPRKGAFAIEPFRAVVFVTLEWLTSGSDISVLSRGGRRCKRGR